MEKFDFHIPQPDLQSLVIESDRLKLLIIDNKFEQDNFILLVDSLMILL